MSWQKAIILNPNEQVMNSWSGNCESARVYPKHDEFMSKIRELDAAGLAKALKRLSFMAQSKVYLFWRKAD